MTPDYIHKVPREALEALKKYHKEIDERGLRLEVDWMHYPYIFAFYEWGIDLVKLEKNIEEIEREINE